MSQGPMGGLFAMSPDARAEDLAADDGAPTAPSEDAGAVAGGAPSDVRKAGADLDGDVEHEARREYFKLLQAEKLVQFYKRKEQHGRYVDRRALADALSQLSAACRQGPQNDSQC